MRDEASGSFSIIVLHSEMYSAACFNACCVMPPQFACLIFWRTVHMSEVCCTCDCICI